jgi:hypothetical protein
MKFLLVTILLCASLTGCGSLNPAIAGYSAKIIADTKAANDNYVAAIEAAICSVPVGAVIRHPEFIPLARTACLPGGVSPDAGVLFTK